MSYASDLGLTVGSEIKVIAPNGGNGIYGDGHVLMLREDDHSKNPTFYNLTTGDDTCCFTITERSDDTTWEHYKEEKDMAKTPFEQAGYTKETKFKVLESQYGFRKGEIVTLDWDDQSSCPRFKSKGGHTAFLFFSTTGESKTDLEVYVEESEADNTNTLEFPCCVAISEIKDEETFKKILDLFIANGADKYEVNWEDGGYYKYFGVDYDDDTVFYSCVESYSFDDVESEVTVYTAEELLAMIPKEETTTTKEVTLLPVGTEVKISESSKYYTYGEPSNPVDIKGVITDNDGEYGGEFCYSVKWENGYRNGYRLNDLVLWEESRYKADDLVKIVDRINGHNFDIGEIVKLVSESPSGSWLAERLDGSDCWHITPDKEFVIASNSTSEVTYKLGDKVVIEDSTLFNIDFVKVGDVATVVGLWGDDDLHLSCPTWGWEQVGSISQVRPFVDVNKEIPSENTQPVYPKVGDKIMIIGNKNGHNFETGEIVTVIEDCSDEEIPNWGCTNKEDLSYVLRGWVYVGEFELVKGEETTTEEVPLVTITQEVKYTVAIKGITFTFTQEEIDGLAEELLGFTTL